jgi:hypothetical protein
VRPINPRLLVDTIEVLPPSYGQDTDAGETQTDGPPIVYQVAVQAWDATIAGARRELVDDTPAGRTRYRILSAAGIGVLTADWRIRWTHRNGVGLASPVLMTSTGADRPPAGIGGRWTTDAESIA